VAIGFLALIGILKIASQKLKSNQH